MIRKSSAIWAAFLMLFVVTVFCTYSSEIDHENRKLPNREFFYVAVFDCQIRLPNDYVLNANEKEEFVFISRAEDAGIVTISDYDESISSFDDKEDVDILDYETVDQFKVHVLRKVYPETARNPSVMTVIHDGRTSVSIIGDDALDWRDFLYPCLDESAAKVFSIMSRP